MSQRSRTPPSIKNSTREEKITRIEEKATQDRAITLKRERGTVTKIGRNGVGGWRGSMMLMKVIYREKY